MDTRSTNAGVHHQNDIWAGVGSSHGVGIGYHPTATGGAVYSIGDDANVSLSVFGKGTGSVLIGNSSNPINLGNGSTLVTIGATGGQVLMAGSTAPFEGMIRLQDTAAATPALFNDTDGGRVFETTHVFAAVNSSHYVIARSNNLPAGVVIGGARAASTAGDVHVTMVKGSTVAVAGTTCTIDFLVFRFRS